MLSNNIVRIALGTAFILLIPLVAMLFTDGVAWNLADFVVAGVLLFGTGLAYELIARKVHSRQHRLIVGIVLAGALLWLWVELAVGLFTNWGS